MRAQEAFGEARLPASSTTGCVVGSRSQVLLPGRGGPRTRSSAGLSDGLRDSSKRWAPPCGLWSPAHLGFAVLKPRSRVCPPRFCGQKRHFAGLSTPVRGLKTTFAGGANVHFETTGWRFATLFEWLKPREIGFPGLLWRFETPERTWSVGFERWCGGSVPGSAATAASVRVVRRRAGAGGVRAVRGRRCAGRRMTLSGARLRRVRCGCRRRVAAW